MATRRLPRLNQAEETFLFQWRCAMRSAIFERGGILLTEPQRNYRFHSVRRWELDFAWPDEHVALEVQGGIWIGGAHARPMNIERDMEKHNALLDLGWRCYQFTPKQIKAGVAVQHLERVILCTRRGTPWTTTSSDTAGKTGSAATSTQREASAPARSGELSLGLPSSRPPF